MKRHGFRFAARLTSATAAIVMAGVVAFTADQPATGSADTETWNMKDKVVKTEAEWRKQLSPEQYEIVRRKGTERAFTGKYWNTKKPGTYQCAGCGLELFRSDEKFDSGCGWPSYWQPAKAGHVATAPDNSHGMRRIEVLCARCGAHLGHVFNDGPQPTGLRYCINSGSLTFSEKPVATTSGPETAPAPGAQP